MPYKPGQAVPRGAGAPTGPQGLQGPQGGPQGPQGPQPPQAMHFKPTDITLSKSIESQFPDKVAMYNQLKRRERELDLTINKMLLDLQDYQQGIAQGFLQDDVEDSDILRIFIYNTSESQPWQTKQEEGKKAPTPVWTLRIEGRLLNDKEPIDSPKRKKFSSFLSALSVELKAKDGKDGELQIKKAPTGSASDARVVEWHDDPSLPEPERLRKQFDGMDVRRAGSSIPAAEIPEGESVSSSEKEIVAHIVIQPKMFPIKLQIVEEPLIELVGKNEITQSECLHKLFNYVKSNNLFQVQEVSGKDVQQQQQQQQHVQQHGQRGHQQNQQQGKDPQGQTKKNVTIKADDLLYRIFDETELTLPRMMELLSTKLLKPIEPIKVEYSINTLRNTTLGEVVIDLKVDKKLVNPGAKPGAEAINGINKLLAEEVLSKESADELLRLNDNVRLDMQMLNYSKLKYDFYRQLSEDPVGFLNRVQERNDEYLKILSSDSVAFGANGMVDEEIVRRSDFYTDGFMKEHVELLLNSGRL